MPYKQIVTTHAFGLRTDGGRVLVQDPETLAVKDITAELLKEGRLNGSGVINVCVTTQLEAAFVQQEKLDIAMAANTKLNKDDPLLDMLSEIFGMQTELNDAVFKKKGIRHGGDLLTTILIRDCTDHSMFGPNDLPNVWLQKYLQALMAEAEELKGSLLWKWWSKDQIDIQNARVEIIDMLHFLISLALVAGLDSHEIYRLYKAKHAINHKRQDEGYSQATKTEADNKTVV
jgi:hypothetical protein